MESDYPKGWDLTRVQRLIDRYDNISDEEMIAEDEAAFAEQNGRTLISVPDDLLPEIRRLMATRKSA